MQRIELANIDSIVNDDTALQKLVASFIGNESGDFIFILPERTSEDTRVGFNNFINKVTWEFERISRNTKIHPTQIKESVVAPEPVVSEDADTLTPKRKK